MITELALNQVEIYWAHDLGDFSKVAESAKNVYLLLGYSESTAKLAGESISEAYKSADKAEIERKNGNEHQEHELYIKAGEHLTNAENMLGYVHSTASNQANWWRHFRHKNITFAFGNLFIQHLKPLGITRFHKVLKISIVLAKVGLAHNKRDKDAAIREAVNYWTLLIKEETKGCPYLG